MGVVDTSTNKKINSVSNIKTSFDNNLRFIAMFKSIFDYQKNLILYLKNRVFPVLER